MGPTKPEPTILLGALQTDRPGRLGIRRTCDSRQRTGRRAVLRRPAASPALSASRKAIFQVLRHFAAMGRLRARASSPSVSAQITVFRRVGRAAQVRRMSPIAMTQRGPLRRNPALAQCGISLGGLRGAPQWWCLIVPRLAPLTHPTITATSAVSRASQAGPPRLECGSHQNRYQREGLSSFHGADR
ncbi:hypothetical protein D9M68_445930 [compost metagenome]